MDNLQNILSNLDIPKDQSAVYLALLKLGSANYTQIAKETGIKRTTLYTIIEKMEKKGIYQQKSLRKKTPSHPSPSTFRQTAKKQSSFSSRHAPI